MGSSFLFILSPNWENIIEKKRSLFFSHPNEIKKKKKRTIGISPLLLLFFIIIIVIMPPAFEPPYSVPVPGAVKKDGETVPYRHFKFADKLVDHPKDIFTLWDMYESGYRDAGGKISLNNPLYLFIVNIARSFSR